MIILNSSGSVATDRR